MTDRIVIPLREIDVRVSRASGPGGQHVNKTSSRVELFWNVRESAVLSDDQRERLLRKLGSRLSSEGTLRVVAAATRSQHRNRELAEQRLQDTVNRALSVPKKRRPTAPTAASREARLASKHRHSRKKELRRLPPDE
ncbi:MAG TPA: alternative ribosome rescue aminoacyl-tRNA hydrolase ArfB [Gemmatimonadaceae bacterium]|nr:alternative ribosome rescue aminoacyl-tRNA hydrolase ArfB [Gemmatimonadaceae bacterium]